MVEEKGLGGAGRQRMLMFLSYFITSSMPLHFS